MLTRVTAPRTGINLSLARVRATQAAVSTTPRGFASSASALAKERLLVLGSGWSGYNVARKVDKNLYDVTVVSPNSYFSFTPFLASTCVGTLEFRCATEPVRNIKHVTFCQGWADNVDFANKVVRVGPSLPPLRDPTVDSPVNVPQHYSAEIEAAYTPSDAYDVPYDKLVIATGCRSAWFGTPGVREHAHFLKDVREARAIRLRLLECLELASEPDATPEEVAKLLSFRVVGGGPTGVEFAAELHDFVHSDVYRLYPHLKDKVTITLYDVAPGILMSFDSSLREYAERKFSRVGVKVQGNTKIVGVGKDWLEFDSGEKEPYGLLVWNTGLQVNEFVHQIEGVSKDVKAIKVGPQLQVLDGDGKHIPGVFAIGDNATPADGTRLPQTAQVASQMAGYMASTLGAVAKGKSLESQAAFEWKNRGSMVFIGNYNSIEGPRARIAGMAAWLVWRSYYMTLAMGWRNRILIPVYWALAFFFGRDITSF
ncbi:uncharacterized protein EHS24_007651 [Apiotrichum porosum]|uniref:NADH:ubiquinone reductase (non-electrogenic) n=1 Tax=Apiotrichum porosum TaxID=105984 RepID=A0A427XV25_9TREE|nr:uncharacterized protein EHS24_007651 [Apiotrichum porosum]RSH82657.1 hypothetical protein EHS24_007651 [Apiotrichum porosum]